MFCPKCGGESAEGQKFCKACGANLQLVSDALAGGDYTLGQLKVDFETLKRSLVESGKSLGEAARREARRATRRAKAQGLGLKRTQYVGWGAPETASNLKNDATSFNGIAGIQIETPKSLPKPREWLRYSRQHNFRDGLISLLTGAGFGAVLYYLGHTLIDSGALNDLEQLSHVHELGRLVSVFFLIAAIPVLKGIAQIAYAIFFAESISTIADRLAPRIIQVPQPSRTLTEKPTLNQVPTERPDPDLNRNITRDGLSEPDKVVVQPVSVTEHTTNILSENHN